jgi:hypothetical protein
MRLFADNVRRSCLEETDSPLLAAAFESLEFERQCGNPSAGRTAVAELAGKFLEAAAQLLGPGVDNPVLAAEILPWVEEFERGARELVGRLDGDTTLTTKHGPARRPAVFGDVLDMFQPLAG